MGWVVRSFRLPLWVGLFGFVALQAVIPTIVLLFAVDNKTAGSLSLAVALPTMLVASLATAKTTSSCSWCRRSRSGGTTVEGELGAMEVVVLGAVVVDVEYGHRVGEERVPPDGEVHAPSQGLLGFGVETAVQ